MYSHPLTNQWPGFDPAHLAYVSPLRLRPGPTSSLMTFVVKGRSEAYDPRGGYPLPFKDALITGEAPYAGLDALVPAAGVEISSVTATARSLADSPDTMGLTMLQRSQIVNWDLGSRDWPAFS